MAEAKQYVFKHQEVAEALVKHLGLREGNWGIYIEFGIQGANIGTLQEEFIPAAIVPVLKIGIQRFEEKSPFTVDAGKISKKTIKPTSRKKEKSGNSV